MSRCTPRTVVACAAVLAVTLSGCGGTADHSEASMPSTVDQAVRFNQIQMIGSHNSYHIAPEARMMDALERIAASNPSVTEGLGDPASLGYTHPPLAQQLDRGIRSFELDLYLDPDGGRFANPLGPGILGVPYPQLPTGMDNPGIKVFHIVDIDYLSNCNPFRACLEAIRRWSDANPRHLPIVIDIELENTGLPAPFDITKVTPWTAPDLDGLDAEIRSVLSPERLLTPDRVRAGASDLRTAVTGAGWPKLGDVRGTVMFFLDNEGALRDAYLDGHPSLRDRVLFTSSGEGQPDGAVLKVNDPGDGSRIRQLVSQGYFVRTRADADLAEARATSFPRRDVALASGAQIVSTDFGPGEADPSSSYVVSFPSPVAARCNPVFTDSGCRDDELDDG